jgi:hypothetical protein
MRVLLQSAYLVLVPIELAPLIEARVVRLEIISRKDFLGSDRLIIWKVMNASPGVCTSPWLSRTATTLASLRLYNVGECGDNALPLWMICPL